MGTGPSLSPRVDELTIGPHGDEVRRASEWLATSCRQRGVPLAVAERLELCLNEALANVITHGGAMAVSEPIRLLLEVHLDEDRGKADVTVSDAGLAFDPLSVPERIRPNSLDEASPGGLGVVMIRRFADWLHYRHEGGHNHLTFGARWSARSDGS